MSDCMVKRVPLYTRRARLAVQGPRVHIVVGACRIVSLVDYAQPPAMERFSEHRALALLHIGFLTQGLYQAQRKVWSRLSACPGCHFGLNVTFLEEDGSVCTFGLSCSGGHFPRTEYKAVS